VDHQIGDVDLHFSRGEVGVYGVTISFADFTGGLDYAFWLKFPENLCEFRVFGIQHELGFAFTISEVDEENSPVISYGVDPSHDVGGGSGVGFAEFVAVMSAFHSFFEIRKSLGII
jgi:hypothetical protein